MSVIDLVKKIEHVPWHLRITGSFQAPRSSPLPQIPRKKSWECGDLQPLPAQNKLLKNPKPLSFILFMRLDADTMEEVSNTSRNTSMTLLPSLRSYKFAKITSTYSKWKKICFYCMYLMLSNCNNVYLTHIIKFLYVEQRQSVGYN